ncbi:acetyl-coenzyme A synthetase N-terminal domain-containing protein, partial [Salipiger sp.]|uniref:acetyl-coenzyme A synthetase N-terminal domain-containing protein n=1 Tax=Salipiger sp. TaxID=2078585 RepID=UPI003A97CD0D
MREELMKDEQPHAGTYPPSPSFTSGAHVDAARYDEMYARSLSDPDGFWAEQAERLEW